MSLFSPETLHTVYDYEKSIKEFILKGARNATISFDYYYFTFSGGHTLSIEKRGTILYVNGKKD